MSDQNSPFNINHSERNGRHNFEPEDDFTLFSPNNRTNTISSFGSGSLAMSMMGSSVHRLQNAPVETVKELIISKALAYKQEKWEVDKDLTTLWNAAHQLSRLHPSWARWEELQLQHETESLAASQVLSEQGEAQDPSLDSLQPIELGEAHNERSITRQQPRTPDQRLQELRKTFESGVTATNHSRVLDDFHYYNVESAVLATSDDKTNPDVDPSRRRDTELIEQFIWLNEIYDGWQLPLANNHLNLNELSTRVANGGKDLEGSQGFNTLNKMYLDIEYRVANQQ